MIVLPVVVLLAVVLVLVLRSRGAGPAGDDVRVARPPVRPPLAADLDRWVAAGLLAQDQATAILAHEAPAAPSPAPTAPAPAGPRSRVPVVAEALGYLGGALALGGVVLVLADRWSDLATGSRLALALAGVVLFGVAGALTPADTDPALARLRAFLWLLSSAATAVAAAVLVTDDRGLSPEAAVACVPAPSPCRAACSGGGGTDRCSRPSPWPRSAWPS